MDRQIVYPGAIPLETDLLNTNKFAMTGMAKLASAIMGESTWLHGLACKPTAPASMSVEVGEGQIYTLQHVDDTAYSSLAADNTNTILKQGLNTSACLFRLEAPALQGHSINYLIQVTYADTDTGPTVLPYYNAADPAIAFSGPANSGTAQSTVRAGKCHLAVKAGIAARTGTQKSPTPDPGYTAAWIITVNNGDLFIEASAVSIAEHAPFLPEDGIITAVQQGCMNRGKANREGDTYHLVCQPPVTKLTDGMRIFFRIPSANTGACKLCVGALPPYPIYDHTSQELKKGSLSLCQQNEVEWNATLNAWILCNSQQRTDWEELDRHYIPVSGGEVKGPLSVEGLLSTDGELSIGEAKVTPQGDVLGKVWNGSLQKWLIQRSAGFLDKQWSYLVWKDPVSRLIIQGGFIERPDDQPVRYHISFPNTCFIVLITQSGHDGKSTYNSHVYNVDRNQFKLRAGKGEPNFYWLAVGF
ncbi:hypothetical protein HFD91_11290 [Enterobacteriaceae bacterium EKM102V]|uniref:gp53-like domain-containing protein n=1 Tax=Pantoea TaxID=53335 RepID=UPI00111DD0A4|nr:MULTISPECIES: hypothetical protein [Pantoea]KAF6660596.1 hypothetical protein HFD91_11290 [Enterobacteriaceae bacterium EKM102V]KAF6669565.1 hypothetical protein HFD97_06720 [Pantoea sp. EKM103V]TPD93595.1 hypothetical protein FJP68_14500 [Pantoea vagans]